MLALPEPKLGRIFFLLNFTKTLVQQTRCITIRSPADLARSTPLARRIASPENENSKAQIVLFYKYQHRIRFVQS